MPPGNQLDDVRGLLRRIGLELAFLDPTQGTAVISELLVSLADALASDTAPGIAAAVETAMGWVAGGVPTLSERLGLWHGWMEEAVTAWGRDQPLPPWPAALEALTKAPATPVPAPPPRQPAGDPRPLFDETAERQAVVVLPEGYDAELMQMFCVEAEELLGEIEGGVLILEQTPEDADTLATVFRGFHTLKGNSAVMKLVVLQRLAHELEALLDAARRGRRRLDRAAIEVILAGADIFSKYVTEAVRQLDGHDVGR